MKQIIARLRELESATTPGPWDCAIGITSEGYIDLLPTGNECVPSRDIDLDLIDEMRNALPQLLDRLEKLEKVVEAATSLVESAITQADILENGDIVPTRCTVDPNTFDGLQDAIAAAVEKE